MEKPMGTDHEDADLQLVGMAETCQLLGVTRPTVALWEAGGRLPRAFRVGSNGQRVWRRADIVAAAQRESERSLPVAQPEELAMTG
jgi:predicted DNA-binding transcriptional regulator AlpA